MNKYIVAAAAFFGLALPTYAEKITSQEALVAYLKEQMPDGQQISRTYNVGDVITVGQNHGGCLSARTLQDLDFITRLLVTNGLMNIVGTKERKGYALIGDTSPACEYEINRFNMYELGKLGIEMPKSDGPATSVTIPLFEQTVLGVTRMDTNSYVSIGMSGTTCDLSFTPWFGSANPSGFALHYKGAFLKDRHYKKAFSSEYESSTWCMQLHYDGTYKWKVWSRL